MADRFIDFSVLNTYQNDRTQTEKENQVYGLLDCIAYNSPMCKALNPKLKEHLRTVEGRSTQYPGLKEDVITTTSVESFTIPAHLSDSEMMTLTAISIFSGFQVYPRYFVNNLVGKEEYMKNKYDEVFAAMAAAKEEYIETLLNTYKTQVWDGVIQVNNGDGTFAFDTGNDWLTANKAAQKDTLFANLKTLFRINKKVGGTNYVINEGGFNLAMNEIWKMGKANNEDRQFTANSIPKFFESLGIAPGSDQFLGFMMRNGAIGIAQNYPSDFRGSKESPPTRVGEKIWGITDRPVPHLNTKLNVYYNKEATDASSLGDTTSHLNMTFMEEWGFLDKFFLISNYNSDLATRPNEIVKFKGLTS